MAFSKKEIQIANEKIKQANLRKNEKIIEKKEKFLRKSITIDQKTNEKIKKFCKDNSVGFSTAIRFIVNNFIKDN